jgi:uncharacterized Rossmann fold enzyme
MEFAEWEPVYEAVLADFGYSRAGDEAARDLLADLLDGEPLDAATLSLGGTVAVVAPGPSLAAERERGRARSADAVVAASTAADRLADAGVTVDVQVTDLDGDPARATRRTREGTPVAVHAHGDNRDALRATVPDCRADRLLPTTQAAPAGVVRNVGGFTDGDRAAFLADALGADRLRFVGWDVDADVAPEKRRKLRWAARLLRWLERRRGDRFPLLDGRRDDLEPVPTG